MHALRRVVITLTLPWLATAAAADTLYVDADLVTGLNDGSSWADAFQTSDGLQAALAVAVAGDDIFVAEGTYLPTQVGTRTIQFRLASGVAVYGGFVGTESSPAERPPFGTAPTILSGDLAGDDGANQFGENSFHVVNGANTDATGVLDGFIVSGGNANGGGNNERGAGLFCFNNASPTIRNCVFTGNQCLFGGGAGYISNSSAPSFTDCTFEQNSGGSFGGVFDMASAGAVRIDRCLFRQNTAARAGAVEIFMTTGVVISNSVFVGNIATGGGGGGAMWLGSGGNTRVRNCTVVANSSTTQAVGGVRVANSPATTVDNCIVWNNTGPGGAQGPDNQVNATAVVTYSIVEGGFPGAGNLASDPLFADAAGEDFELTAGSPAIDAADNTQVPAGVVLDFASNPRFFDDPGVADTGVGPAPVVDVGAHEFGGGGVVFYCTPKTSSAGCVTLLDSSSPALPVSGANDYSVIAQNVQGLKNGLVFVGVNGPAAAPFNGGILVHEPTGSARAARELRRLRRERMRRRARDDRQRRHDRPGRPRRRPGQHRLVSVLVPRSAERRRAARYRAVGRGPARLPLIARAPAAE